MVVTVTETVPVPAGTVTVSEVELVTSTEVPACGAEVDRGRARDEPGAGHRDGVATGLGPVVRGDRGDRRRRVVGVLVTRRLTAEVPLGVVTVTSTVPVPAGAVTVRLVAVTPVIEVPGFVPKSTAVAPVKLVPLTVTELPPPGARCSG